jgi:hypothetical protein
MFPDSPKHAIMIVAAVAALWFAYKYFYDGRFMYMKLVTQAPVVNQSTGATGVATTVTPVVANISSGVVTMTSESPVTTVAPN